MRGLSSGGGNGFSCPFADLHDTGEYIALLGKQHPHLIDDRAHARSAAQVAMDDHPVRGGKLGTPAADQVLIGTLEFR